MSERTGATDAKPWIISADPRFTTHEGGTVIVSGGTVYGDGYVIARAADVLTTEQRADIATVISAAEAWISEFDYDKNNMDYYNNGMAAIKRLSAIAEGGTE